MPNLGVAHTQVARDAISKAMKEKWQVRHQRAALITYAATEALDALEQAERLNVGLTVWLRLNPDAPQAAEDRQVRRVVAAMDRATEAVRTLRQVVADNEE